MYRLLSSPNNQDTDEAPIKDRHIIAKLDAKRTACGLPVNDDTWSLTIEAADGDSISFEESICPKCKKLFGSNPKRFVHDKSILAQLPEENPFTSVIQAIEKAITS